ncbi:MAG: AzlD domain-containing protein [Clostridia bacterium]|nr:AzlD domain-containing protein [Clostridia bacterium]
MKPEQFIIYLAAMAAVTYLVRMVPLVIFKKQIKNKYVLSFLSYMPYAVLSAMAFPAVFFATGNVISAAVGFAVALTAAFFKRGLITVAALASAAALITELIIRYVI